MIALELAAMAIVVIYATVRMRFGPAPKRWLLRLVFLVVASWVAEDSCIQLYGFYTYNPNWSVFVHHVPLAVLLIWPIVILSAWEVSTKLCPERSLWVAPVGALLVLADAMLIEPVSVASKLWWWHEPGLFLVPPIGLLGWSFHAGLCMAVLQRAQGRGAIADAAMVAVAPLLTHFLLLGTWWGGLRWLSAPIPTKPAVGLVVLAAVVLTVVSLAKGWRRRLEPRDMLTRIPAALFFLFLLWRDSANNVWLVVYALAFAPPYLSLTRLRSGGLALAAEPGAANGGPGV